MRRRDANGDSLYSFRLLNRRTAVSLAVAVALHAALLVLAALALVQQGLGSGRLIRVTLATGGRAGSASTVAPAGSPAGLVAEIPAASPSTDRTVHPIRSKKVAAGLRGGRIQRSQAQSPAPAEEPQEDTTLIVATGASGRDNNGGGSGSGSAGLGNGSGGGAGAGGTGESATDQRAYCLYCPEPRYPLIARTRGWHGTVDVALSVLADGSVAGARLQRSSGYGVLDAAAVAVARQSRFAPPVSRGAPLQGYIEYRFELSASQ